MSKHDDDLRRDQRDEFGWRIPREGTRSRAVYNFYKADVKPAEIAKLLGMRVQTVSSIIFIFRHPDKQNRRARDSWRKRTGRLPPAPPAPAFDLERAQRIAAEHGFKVALDHTGALRVVGFPDSWGA